MLAPALRDTHQGSAIAAGKLPGYKANPGGEMAPVLELGAIADRSHDGCRCLRAHTLDLRDPLAGLTRPEDSLDLLIKDPDPPVEIPEDRRVRRLPRAPVSSAHSRDQRGVQGAIFWRG